MSSLYVKQFVDASLGNSSYLVASTESGLAAVIDPQRDIDRYVRAAEGLGLQLAYALDTHLHADFVSGARELAAQSNGAFRIGASAQARVSFEHLPLSEGDTLSLGDVSIEVLTTPGHTPEHISFTTAPIGSHAPHALFSGGALIVGGAGRTDLLGHDLSEPLAQQLYHTLHHKLLHLPDQVTVYPTHGAGSFCNAPASPAGVTTIGRERSTNRLAQINSEEEFVRAALSDLPSYPTYYRYMRAVNRTGPLVLGGVPELKPLPPTDVCHLSKNGSELHEWTQHTDAPLILDVRFEHEWRDGHLPNALHIEAGHVRDQIDRIPRDRQVVVHCGAANRATISASLLEQHGYTNVTVLDTGFNPWREAGYEVVEEVRGSDYTSTKEFEVAIVGAGASGTLVAAQLCKLGPEVRVALVGNAARSARGVAYDTAYQSCLLNVPAGNMSTFPEDRDHFARWFAQQRSGATGKDFAPRTLYGDYLAEILAEALRAPTTITPITGEVVSMMRYGDRWLLQLADGSTLAARSVVLAVGNLPPNDPAGFSAEMLGYWSNPWAADMARDLPSDAPVLIIGTGLTMIDVVLALRETGHRGPIAALSHHGRLYQRHRSFTPHPLAQLPAGLDSPRRALRWVRTEVESAQREGYDWRAVIDSLRPHTATIWHSWSLAQRASFLRHARNVWDIHRHRVPPQVGAQLDSLIDQGTLSIHAGRIIAAEAAAHGVRVSWLPKDGDDPH